MSAYREETAVYGFDQRDRSNTGASLRVQWQGDSVAAGLSASYANDPDDNQEWRLDGSYVAATASNWVFGVGAIDRWWGPGWQSSLILSSNARAMPSVWLNRNISFAPETSWLQWVGPWQLTLLAGQYENDRAVPDAKLLGARFTMRPIQGLDIGLSRIIMIGGEGRPEDLGTLWDAIIGRDNGQEGQANDPGNQLGSIDARYGFGLGQQSLGVYGQMMGEDEAGAFPARKSWLWGVDWTTQLIGADQQWFLEYVNTLADDFLGDPLPNVTYEHSQYRTGYRYLGRNMGSTFGGDAEAVTLGVFNFFDNGSVARIKASYMDLNQDGGNRVEVVDPDVFYYTASGRQRAALLDLGFGSRFLQGWLNLSMQISDKKLVYLSGQKDQWSMGADWTYRF
ncbi:capsule assembly Wzi family protein [Marinobacter zhejiangensis]|nr:capsule assembly Wzi family protein [Marinobacter zhejiangensis]